MNFRLSLSRTTLALSALLALPAFAQGAGPALYAWTQFTADGAPIARAVIPAMPGNCPGFTSSAGGGVSVPRGAPPPGFEEIKVCEAALPPGATDIVLGGIAVPHVPSAPQRVAVLGDTGCRIKGHDFQNCNGNGTGPVWNFATIAAEAAEETPDLILHMGDMHYREYVDGCALPPSPTPAQQAAFDTCVTAQAPGVDPRTLGLTWVSWQADFFEPAKPLLAAAPWIFARGNHEDCTRAWRGWFYLLDARPLPGTPWPANCPALSGTPVGAPGADYLYTAPYSIDFANQQVIVMDSSYIANAFSPTPDPATVSIYAKQFDAVDKLARSVIVPSWLITHRPFWALSSYFDHNGTEQVSTTDPTLQGAIAASTGGALPPDIRIVMAGHVHLFERLTFTDGRPTQYVFGAGGTMLDPTLEGTLAQATAAGLASLGADPATFDTTHAFDFGIVTPDSSGWTVTVHSIETFADSN